MAPNFSKYANKNYAIAAAGLTTLLWILSKKSKVQITQPFREKVTKNGEEVKYLIAEKSAPPLRANVDRKFFVQLGTLLKIVIPGLASTESILMFLVAISLIARSICDIWLIDSGTKIERKKIHSQLKHVLLKSWVKSWNT